MKKPLLSLLLGAAGPIVLVSGVLGLLSRAEQLPRTGQLWWPVPLLAVLGLVVFSIGWILSRKKDDEK